MPPKRRFTTNLKGMQHQCESNYLRLCELISDWSEFDKLELVIDASPGPQMHVTLAMQERNPYTSTIMLHQQDVLLPWVEGPELSVRVYHDARMAEVISWNRHRLLRARYEYPNERMYLPDEKAQLNQFLGECLGQCLAHGRALETVQFS